MSRPKSTLAQPASARSKLLEAALSVIRAKGYSATTVDQMCEAAGVTKGAFFHHFKSKDDLAVAALSYWSEKTGALFAAAPYHRHADPLDRVLGYIDFRRALLKGAVSEFTCLAGTMAQEIHETHPAIRDACGASITDHAEKLEADIAMAMSMSMLISKKPHGMQASWTAQSLALHTQAVIQGAFILAKAKNDLQAADECLAHLKRYVELLFSRSSQQT